MLFVGAGGVRRHIGLGIARSDKAIAEQIVLNLFPAHVSQHCAVDLDARRQRLAGLLDHFRVLIRVIDDVAVFVFETILLHDRPNAHTPAAGRF